MAFDVQCLGCRIGHGIGANPPGRQVERLSRKLACPDSVANSDVAVCVSVQALILMPAKEAEPVRLVSPDGLLSVQHIPDGNFDQLCFFRHQRHTVIGVAEVATLQR